MRSSARALLLLGVLGMRAQAGPALTVAVQDATAAGAVEFLGGRAIIGTLVYEATGCAAPQAGCRLHIRAASSTTRTGTPMTGIEWQLDGTAPGRWRPLTLDGELVAVIARSPARGTIYVSKRLSWERDRPEPADLALLRLTLRQW